MEPASVKNLDPPMVQQIWPAGFPLREDSPRLLSDFSVGERNMRQVAPRSADELHLSQPIEALSLLNAENKVIESLALIRKELWR